MEFSMQLSVLFSSKHCLWLDLPPFLLPFYFILAGSAGGKAPSPLQLHHVWKSLCVCLVVPLSKGENLGGSSTCPALDVPVPAVAVGWFLYKVLSFSWASSHPEWPHPSACNPGYLSCRICLQSRPGCEVLLNPGCWACAESESG